MIVDDAELVALIDDELDDEAKARLLAQLAADEGLRQRYGALREAGAHISASFDALLGTAPLSPLNAPLPSEASPTRPLAHACLTGCISWTSTVFLKAVPGGWPMI